MSGGPERTGRRVGRRALLGLVLTAPLAATACGSGGPLPGPAPSSTPGTPSPTTSEVVVRVLTDQAYAEPVDGSATAHLLDLHLPDGAPGPWPVVLFQAGSAFRSDDTKGGSTGLSGGTTAAGLAQRWGPLGYAVAGVNVRSSAQARFPAQLHDVKAAVRYLRSRADELGLDAGRVVTAGTSSGGWGAVMAGVVTGVPELEGAELGHADQPSDVQAVVDLFGPTAFLRMDAQRLPDGQEHDPAGSPESELLGFPIQSDPAATERTDPTGYVSAGSPPVWIAHGTADPLVPHQQSELLFAAYERAGATASLTLVTGAGHTDAYLSTGAPDRVVRTTAGGTTTEGSGPDPTYDAVLAFLQEHLGRG